MQTPTVYRILEILKSRVSQKKENPSAYDFWLESTKLRSENYENWKDFHNLGLAKEAEIAWQTREMFADVGAVLGLIAFRK